MDQNGLEIAHKEIKKMEKAKESSIGSEASLKKFSFNDLRKENTEFLAKFWL